jgi:predicted small secreted protein
MSDNMKKLNLSSALAVAAIALAACTNGQRGVV